MLSFGFFSDSSFEQKSRLFKIFHKIIPTLKYLAEMLIPDVVSSCLLWTIEENPVHDIFHLFRTFIWLQIEHKNCKDCNSANTDDITLNLIFLETFQCELWQDVIFFWIA